MKKIHIILLCLPLQQSLQLLSAEQVSATPATNNPYAQQTATVRIGTELCSDELNYIQGRLPRIKKALESVTGMKLQDHEVPRIAICTSGGGMRAMISTLGWLNGTEIKQKRTQTSPPSFSIKPYIASAIQYMINALWGETGPTGGLPLTENFPPSLVDCCSHISALSGSTWAIASWLQSHMPIKNYIDHLAKIVNNETLLNDVDCKDVIFELLKKYEYNQQITVVDIYGCLLAQKFLQNLGSHNQNAFDLVSYWYPFNNTYSAPLPIYTAALSKTKKDYKWVEFTPYEIGSTHLNSFIPTWAFGRTFYNGFSQDFAPVQSLGFGMGIWSSIMGINVHEFYMHVIKPKLKRLLGEYIATQVNTIIEQELNNNHLADYRPFTAKVNNWAYGIPNTNLNNSQQLDLVDAGIDYSIPLLPVLRSERNANIIIILDASSCQSDYELRKAETDAIRNGYRLPHINYAQLGNICSVHSDSSDLSLPTIIYLPLIKNNNYKNGWNPHAATFTTLFNIKYSTEEVHQLAGLTTYNMQESQPIIINAIKEWILIRRK